MIVIKTHIIPPPGYKAMTIGPFILTKHKLNSVDINHEAIHWEQEKELGIIGFYILYLIYFLCLLIKNHGVWKKSYREIPFEVEAYKHQWDFDYTKTRKHYGYFQK